jgi:hypothetical protein
VSALTYLSVNVQLRILVSLTLAATQFITATFMTGGVAIGIGFPPDLVPEGAGFALLNWLGARPAVITEGDPRREWHSGSLGMAQCAG